MADRTKTLRVAPGLALPLDIVTQKNAILAQSGAGKSNTAVVLAEEMYRAGVPWIAVDPKGDWFGVRSSKDGKGPGLKVPVFGGEHGDVGLSARSGTRMAELVAEGKVTGIFDVSEFDTKADLVRFLADFAETLLARQRTPLHIFCEECDEYLPQIGGGRTDPQQTRCLGAWKRLAKRGRFRGIGITLVSQRAAAVNKDALNQTDNLIAMRVTMPRDRAAIEDIVKHEEHGDKIVKSLHTLGDGEAWVWSPHRLKLVQRVQFRRRETYDSGRTPEIGEALVVPKLADIDLDALRAEMEEQDVGDELDANGLERERYAGELGGLRARLQELQAELEQARATPALSEATVARLEAAARTMHETGIAAVEAARDVMAALPGGHVLPRSAEPGPAPKRRIPQKCLPPGESVNQPAKVSTPPAGADMPAGERRMLLAIAQHPKGATREQLTVLTGFKKTTRNLYLQRLAKQDWIATGADGRFRATPGGLRALGSFERLPTGRALLEHWLSELPGGESDVLRLIAGKHPKPVTRAEIDAGTGYKKTTRNLYLQRLSRRELVVAHAGGAVALSPELVG